MCEKNVKQSKWKSCGLLYRVIKRARNNLSRSANIYSLFFYVILTLFLSKVLVKLVTSM